uniref:TRASH domain-containing protein n=1 Tax=Xiphophorus couchianus TaxID=32473 RepID=A0A3B5MD48_9TELE
MGLGEFADSSRGSVGSSKSGGQPESKGLDETLEQAESQPLEEDSNSSRQEKKTDEGTGETSFPPLTSSSSEKLSSFNMVRSERGGGGSGGAAFDDALDGLPSYGPEEEDEEDWHYALPMGSLEDVDVGKASKISQLGQENSASQSNPFDQKPEVEEEEQENEGSTESVLLKGQTAFQRKGSTQLFCSTVCLTGHLPPITKGRASENSTFMHFCGQFCLSVYRHKKKQGEKFIIDKRPERKPEKPPEKPIEHEVTYQGKLHRLCSDNCFLTWRKQRQLALNCCEGCGLYCSSKSGSCHTLTIEKSQLNFCSSTCIGTFKQVCCTPFPCGLCKVSAVPQYHLAMVDGTIRSFCSLACVTTFRGRILLLCSKSCCDQYNTQKNVLSVCDYCKEEKVLYEVTSFSHQDVFFCSECTLKDHVLFSAYERALRPCSYCSLGQGLLAPLGLDPSVIKSDVLFPHCSSAQMGRCDSCRKQGYMSEKLQCLGSVCNFCNMACLLQYCCLHFEASQHTSNGMASAPPLPSGSKLFKIKVSYPVVCCFKTLTFLFLPLLIIISAADREENMKVFMVPVPVPVPVFVPVPMNMYSQHTPVAMVVPISHHLSIQGRRRTGSADRSVSGTPASSKLNHLYGVKAWTSWIQQSNKQPTECEATSSRVVFKEDIVQCSSAELGFALTRFIREVRRPNGEPYSPDSIFYLCLGIQQHLFLRGRIENIFTDEVYSHFQLAILTPSELKFFLIFPTFPFPPSGGIVPSRIEESYLWECKQLGAYSPIVLLNTLLFFCTKHLHLTTLAEHQRLSFSNFTRRYKPQGTAGNVYLQYERNSTGTSGSEQKGGASKKHQVGSNGEMWENAANPLQCPVRLYEFYLSRCMFYLRPQRNVHTCRSR